MNYVLVSCNTNSTDYLFKQWCQCMLGFGSLYPWLGASATQLSSLDAWCLQVSSFEYLLTVSFQPVVAPSARLLTLFRKCLVLSTLLLFLLLSAALGPLLTHQLCRRVRSTSAGSLFGCRSVWALRLKTNPAASSLFSLVLNSRQNTSRWPHSVWWFKLPNFWLHFTTCQCHSCKCRWVVFKLSVVFRGHFFKLAQQGSRVCRFLSGSLLGLCLWAAGSSTS